MGHNQRGKKVSSTKIIYHHHWGRPMINEQCYILTQMFGKYKELMQICS